MSGGKWLLLWEAALTAFSNAAASVGFAGIVPAKPAALMVIIATSLNLGTIVYRTGQWNPLTPPSIPVHLTATATVPPDPPHVAE
jgi:hypothetical protein